MTDPIAFDSTTPRWNLPFLFAGQAQKEAFVNEAHALVDALLHPTVEGEADAPPADPQDGDCWLVGPAPTGDWSDRAGLLACRQQGVWLFAAPRDGMRLFDRAAGHMRFYNGGWFAPTAPAAPSGGVVIDAESRAAISLLIDRLREAGIF